MPISPKAMAVRSRHGEEELRLKAEIFTLDRTIAHSKPRKNTRMMEVLLTLYSRFGDQKRIPAIELEDIKLTFHPPTYNKAKKLLGIRSVRRDGKWFWTAPRRTPEEAAELSYKNRVEELNMARAELNKLESQVCITLRELMEGYSMCAENVTVFKDMETRGYSRSSSLVAKSKLKIASKKYEGKWLWIWHNKDVQDWLEQRIGQGEVRVTDIFHEAWEDHKWHMETVKMAREAIGSIQFKSDENGKVCWFNISQLSEESMPINLKMASELPVKDTGDEAPRTERNDYSPHRMRNQGTRPKVEAHVDNRILTVDFEGVKSFPVDMNEAFVEDAYDPAIDEEFPDVETS